MCHHHHLLLVIVFLFTLPAYAQQVSISSDQVLKSAWLDPTIEQRNKELEFLGEAKLSIPLLEEVELRTETQEFDLVQQEYAMRLKFNSPRQRKLQSELNRNEVNLRQLALNETLENQLYRRYELLLNLALAQREAQALDRQAAWYEDQETVLQRELNLSGERKIDDWLKLEDDRLAYTQARLINQQKTELLQVTLTQLLGPLDGRFTPSTNDLLDIPKLRTRLLAIQATTPTLPYKVQAQAIEVELLRLEAAGELAEQRNLLQFLQLRYNGNDDPIFSDRLTVGAGVRLPLRSSSNVKQQYLELERIEEENQGKELLTKWRQELATTEAQLQANLHRYDELAAALQSFETQYAPTRLRDQGVSDVQILLRAQGSIYQRQQLLNQQAAEVYQSYLEFLLQTGRLIQTPYRNWLRMSEEPM